VDSTFHQNAKDSIISPKPMTSRTYIYNQFIFYVVPTIFYYKFSIALVYELIENIIDDQSMQNNKSEKNNTLFKNVTKCFDNGVANTCDLMKIYLVDYYSL
jgi:hypothetical protein